MWRCADRRMLNAMPCSSPHPTLRWRATSSAVIAVALCAACAEPPAGAQDRNAREDLRREVGAEAAARLEHLERAPEAEPPIRGEVPLSVIDVLKADLMARTNADPATIEIIRAEAVIWSSGALGCPEPDQVYTQAQVRGFHVVLAVPERRYDYRVIENGPFRLCD
jgi:hypothetical protein